MKLLKKTVLIGTTLLLGSFLLAACGNTNKEANNADKTHEVTDTLGNRCVDVYKRQPSNR